MKKLVAAMKLLKSPIPCREIPIGVGQRHQVLDFPT